MPWYKKPMKDAPGCDKPREAVEKRYTLGFPNGKTHPLLSGNHMMNI